MKTNFKYIKEGDSKDIILDSINTNFDQILFSGVGYKGDYGPRGPKGLKGQIGRMGPSGLTGDRATKWFRQDNEPMEGVNDYDYWINTSSGASGSDSIYLYNSGSWTYTGESLLRGSTLFKYSGILGPSGVTNKNAIIDSDYSNPYSSTFVLSDSLVDETNVNLNYSKLKIINSLNQDLPILSFCKSDYNDPLHPSFYWRSEDPDDLGISHRGSGKLRIDASGEVLLYAGDSSNPLSDGNFSIYSGSLNLNSSGTIGLNSGGTGPNGFSMEMSIAQSINIQSINLSTASDIMSFKRGLLIGGTGESGGRLNISSVTPSSSGSGSVYFNSYITDPSNLTFTDTLTVDDFRLDDIQSSGEGPFRTEIVGITGALSGNLYMPYAKFGFPGVLGAYSTTGVYQITTSYSGYPSIINLSSASHYLKQGISVVTTNTSAPVGGKAYVKISQSLSSLTDSQYPTTYRFYYKGTQVSPGSTITRNRKFSGINFTRSNGFTSSQVYLDFNQDVETFEITYDITNNLFYYRAMGSCGIEKFFENAIEEEIGLGPLGAF